MAPTASARSLARFERRIRRRLGVQLALDRTAASLPAILQIVVGVIASYSIAFYALGHTSPLLAITVVISSLGFARDARPRRVLESAVGILVGVALSEVLLLGIGRGLWQMALTLVVTLVVARLVTSSNAFAIAAGVQSMLVLVLPTAPGGVFNRSIDAAVGGVIALAVTALVPRDPRRIAGRDARRLLSTLTESLGTLVTGLRDGDEGAASLSITRLRRTQSLVDDWSSSLESAIAIARISPFLRRHLAELRHQARVLAGMDLAARHLRVIARRASFLVRDGRSRPEIANLLARVNQDVVLLGESIDRPDAAAAAARDLADIATTLDPAELIPDAAVTDSVLVLLVRPLVVDLLVAAGRDEDQARALLPVLSG
jgi:uncharacterized membrane protein YgaE (UPF0421/DUF939 family)